MSAELKKELNRRLGTRASFGEPMSRHTTWRVGGPAWCLAQLHDAEEVAWLVAACRTAGLSYKALGRGSNLLVSDSGYPGVMIRLQGELSELSTCPGGLDCGGGASLSAAVRLSTQEGLAGLEWASGIPASLGGALATNAGAHGGDMSELASRITLLDPDRGICEMAGSELASGYRYRALPAGSLVLAVRLGLSPATPREVEERRAALLDLRKANQPLDARTAGSVFKNPPGDHAGRLIEDAGLKGFSIGGAVVSTTHANFIENRGQATAADVLAVMNAMTLKVMDNFHIKLEPEIEMVGLA